MAQQGETDAASPRQSHGQHESRWSKRQIGTRQPSTIILGYKSQNVNLRPFVSRRGEFWSISPPCEQGGSLELYAG